MTGCTLLEDTSSSMHKQTIKMPQPPNKKALSISVQYSHLRSQGLELTHTHQDSDNIVKLLIGTSFYLVWRYSSLIGELENFGFSEDDIIVLKDGDDENGLAPTRENIVQCF